MNGRGTVWRRGGRHGRTVKFVLAVTVLVAGCAGQTVIVGNGATASLPLGTGSSATALASTDGGTHTTGQSGVARPTLTATTATDTTATTTTAATTTAPTTTTTTARPVLQHPRWSALPEAPIDGRENGASAWTGTAWIIWGGSTMQSSRYFADGASYDPKSRTWATLPAAPITGRSGVVSVWTGTSLFVWGGQNAEGGQLLDGALYTPSTRSWIKVEAPPNLPGADTSHGLTVQAVWTGSRVALVGVRDGDTAVFVRYYDPQANSWTTSTAIGLDPHHHGQIVAVAATGPTVYVFVYWVDSHPVGNSTFESTSGTDGFTLDENGESTPNRLAAEAGTVAPRILALGTTSGSELLFPAGQPYCGFCSGPYRFNLHSVLADPASGTLTDLPHGPDDDLGAEFLWTGSSLLAYDTGTFTTNQNGKATYPGGASVYDPTTTAWRTLPSAPLAGAGFSAWTGSALLEWGEMYKPTSANTGKTQFQAAGLELTG